MGAGSKSRLATARLDWKFPALVADGMSHLVALHCKARERDGSCVWLSIREVHAKMSWSAVTRIQPSRVDSFPRNRMTESICVSEFGGNATCRVGNSIPSGMARDTTTLAVVAPGLFNPMLVLKSAESSA